MNNILLKINKLLLDKNIEKKEFANLIEIADKTLYNIFDGKSSLKVEHLIKIAEVLEVPVAYFFEEGNEPPCAVKKTDSQTSRIEQLLIENSALKDKIIELLSQKII